MSPRRHLPLLAAGIAVAALLTGCTPEPSEPSQTPTASAAPEASVDTEASGADEAGIDPDNPPEALGSTSVPRGGDEGVDSVLIEVVGMRQVEDVLVMTARITAEGEGGDVVSIYNALGGTSFYPALLDYENLKRYDYVPGLATDSIFTEAPLGVPMYATATFAYPEGAEVVDVAINSSIPPIAGIPVP